MPGFDFTVQQWVKDDRCDTLALCRTLAQARAVFAVAVEEKPTGRFIIRNRAQVVLRYPDDDW